MTSRRRSSAPSRPSTTASRSTPGRCKEKLASSGPHGGLDPEGVRRRPAAGCSTSASSSRSSAGRAAAWASCTPSTRSARSRSSSPAPRRRSSKYLPEIASGRKLIAFGLSERSAGCDAGGLPARATVEGGSIVLDGDKKWTTNGGAADIYTVFAVTDPESRSRRISGVIVGEGRPRVHDRARRGQDGHPLRARRRAPLRRTAASRRSACSAASAASASSTRCRRSTARAPASPRRPWASRRARSSSRSSTRTAASSSARRSRASRWCSRCWPTWRPRSRRRASWCYAAARAIDAGAELRGHAPGRAGEALRDRRGHGGHDGRGADLRRLRLHARLPGREVHARREDHADLRGHEPGASASWWRRSLLKEAMSLDHLKAYMPLPDHPNTQHDRERAQKASAPRA